MKALVGSWDSAPHKLLAEITALRSKVAQLRAENADLRAEIAMMRDLRDAASSEQLASTSA
ncbi:MAG TPA: hypothetical protein VMM13_01755 [Euzebya sp.]|nr:hypothetical protein [Euzebya sp.]